MLPKIGVLAPTGRIERVLSAGEEDIICKTSHLGETTVNRTVWANVCTTGVKGW